MFHAGQLHWSWQRQDPAEVLAADGCFHSGKGGRICAWLRDTLGSKEAESAYSSPTGSQSAAMDEQAGCFKARDKRRCCRGGHGIAGTSQWCSALWI